MSRRVKVNNRGGPTSQSSSMRKPQIKLTFGAKSGTKNGIREVPAVKKSKKRRMPSFSDADSTSSGDFSEEIDNDDMDDDSDEADDESDEPGVDALPHNKHAHRHAALRGGAGPGYPSDDELEPFSIDDGEWHGFPEMPDKDPNDWDQTMNQTLFESDDDLVYEKVHDISDMEDDEAANEEAEEAALVAEFDEDMTSHFANQIDGMSAYGFGDNSDDEGSILFPWSSDDDAPDAQRRVRFEENMDLKQQREVGMPNAFAVFGQSPAMARALLPSALPETSDDNSAEPDCNADDENDYDSDATEELETPAATWRLHHGIPQKENQQSSPPVPAKKSPSRHRGPVRGTFDDDGDKATAILDPTGRKLLINDSHLLGGVFARKYGPSVPGSPSNSFASLLNESDDSQSVGSQTPRQSQPQIDLMLSALNSGEHVSNNGQASGFPEAFMPASQDLLSDFIAVDALPDDDDGMPDGDLKLEDIIFDPDGDDESVPGSPLPSRADTSFSAPNSPLSHLNHLNVSAFKRKTERPDYFNEPRPSPLRNRTTPLKRKRRVDKYESPYNDAHYQGVTPVQRITTYEHPSSPIPPPSRMHKRRRTIF